MIRRNYTIPKSEPVIQRKLCETTGASFTCPYCKIVVENPPPGQRYTCGSRKCKQKRASEIRRNKNANRSQADH